MSKAKIIAHMGWRARYPENTLAAFQKALELPVFGIECDVRLTADRVPVVIHDATVDRTTDGTGKVSELSFSDLRRLNASVHADYPLDHCPIPSLTETLALFSRFRSEDGLFDLELKVPQGAAGEEGGALVDAVLKALEEFARLERQVMFTSFDADCLSYLKIVRPTAAVGLLADSPHSAPWKLARGRGFSAVLLNHQHVDEGIVASCRQEGLTVAVWTVDDARQLRRFANAHVDLLITNAPDVALAVQSRFPS